MRLELEQSLSKRFPFFQCQTSSVRDEWYGILERLFTELVRLDLPWHFRIVRVKNKFGRLRVYTSDAGALNERIQELTIAAEFESVRRT